MFNPFKKIPVMLIIGGFDPLHSGHINYIKAAKEYVGKRGILVVGLNSDAWLTKKKGKPFLNIWERHRIIRELRDVDCSLTFSDDEIGSAINAMILTEKLYPPENYKLYFGNGGDRTQNNTPEMSWVSDTNRKFKFVFGLGGIKTNSSSVILRDWNEHNERHTIGLPPRD